MKTPTRFTVRGVFYSFGADSLFPLTGFITAVFLSRSFGPALYGVFALMATLVFWAEQLMVAFCSKATIKWVGGAERWQAAAGRAFGVYLLLGVLTSAVLFLTAPLLTAALDLPEMTLPLRLFSLQPFLSALAISHRTLLTARGQFEHRAVLLAARWIGRMLFIIVFVSSGLSIQGAILGSLAAVGLEFLLGRRYIKPNVREGIHAPVTEFLTLAMPLFVYDLFLNVALRADLLWLKVLGGSAELTGHYAAAQNVAIVPLLFISSLANILLSTANHYIKQGREAQARELGRRILKIIFWLLPISSIIAASRYDLIDLIFGADYRPAGSVLGVLCYLTIPLLLIRISAGLLVAGDRPKWPTLIFLPVLPLLLIALYILVPPFGAVGAAVSTLFVFCFAAVGFLAAVYFRWRLWPRFLQLVKMAVVSAFLFALGEYWQSSGIGVLLECGVLFFINIAALFLIGEITAKDRQIVLQALQRKTGKA